MPIAAADAAIAAGTAASAATTRATPSEISAVVAIRTSPGISIWLGKSFILGDICSCSKVVGSAGRKVGRCRHVSHRVRMVSSILKNSQEMPQKLKTRAATNRTQWIKRSILFNPELRLHSTVCVLQLNSSLNTIELFYEEFVHGVFKVKVCADEVILRFQRVPGFRKMKIDKAGLQNDLEQLTCVIVLNVVIFVFDCP
jgi:hypothetical protein